MERLADALEEFAEGLNANALDGVIETVRDAKSEDQLALFATAILGEESVLVRTLMKESSKKGLKELKEAKKKGYETLMAVITTLGKRATPFAPALMVRLAATLWKEAEAGAAEELLEVMEAVLRLEPPGEPCDPADWAERLGLHNLTKDLLHNYSKGQRSQTVKGRMLALLGALAELYPGRITLDKREKLIGERILSELRAEMPKLTDPHGRPQMQIIAGAMAGLSGYLENFAEELERPGSPLPNELYGWVLTCLRRAVEGGAQRYALPRGALGILRRHAPLFGPQLAADFEALLNDLTALAAHRNSDLRRDAIAAADAFLREACGRMAPAAGPRAAAAYRCLLARALTTLAAPAPPAGETHLALVAASALAGPVARFAGADDVARLLLRVLAFAGRLHEGPPEAQDEAAVHLPPLLRAAGALLHECPAAPEGALPGLRRLLAAAFLAYPRLFGRQREALRAPLRLLLAALHAKASLLPAVLADTLFHGMLLTISSEGHGARRGMARPAPTGAVDTLEFDLPAPWRAYEELWGVLLSGRLAAADEFVLPDAARQEDLAAAVYDAFVDGAVLAVLRRLDLSYALADPDAPDEPGAGGAGGGASDGGGGDEGEERAPRLVPEVPKDHALFAVFVELLESLLPAHGPELFARWALPFGREVVAMAQRLPLVSGLDRLLRTALAILSDKRYFEPGADVPDPAARDAAFAVYCGHLEEACARAAALRDERLVACLEMLLAAPPPCLRFPAFLRPLDLALRLGPALPALAARALDALDRWLDATREAPPGPRSLLAHLPALAPALEPYLLPAPADDAGPAADTAALSVALTRGGRAPRSAAAVRRRVEERRGRLAALAARSRQQPEAAAWADLQRRALRVLARMGGDCHALAATADDEEAAAMEAAQPWGAVPRVALTLPVRDNRLEVHLDGLLPLLAELAEGAPERATKAAACEALHALAVHVVALDHRGAASGPDDDRPPFQAIYRRLFPVVLRLAVDPETVARTLFARLALQLVAWFSRGAQSAEATAGELLEAATVAAASAGGGAAALREFGARCIAAFAKYALRHFGANAASEAAAGQVKAVMRRVGALLRHPDPCRRAGACHALSHPDFYRELREQRAAALKHALPLLQHALAAARAADGDDPAAGTAALAVEAVNHMKRIAVRYAGELKRAPEKERKKHPEWSSLPAFVERLFTAEASAPEPRYRHLCAGLFLELAVELDGVTMAAAWARQYAARAGLSGVVRALEGGGDRLAERPAPPEAGKEEAGSEDEAVRWLRQLAASCEAYAWAAAKGLADPAALLGDPTCGLSAAARHFLGSFALHGNTADARLAPDAPPAAPEAGRVREARGAAAAALLELLAVLAVGHPRALAAHAAELEPSEIGSGLEKRAGAAPAAAWLAPADALPRLLAWALFGPSALGAPREPDAPIPRRRAQPGQPPAPAPAPAAEGAREKPDELAPGGRAAARLRALARRLLAALPKALDATRAARLGAVLSAVLTASRFRLEALPAACAGGGDPAAAADLLAGYAEMLRHATLPAALSAAGLPPDPGLPVRLARAAAGVPAEAPPGRRLLARRLLALAFDAGLPPNALLDLISDDSPARSGLAAPAAGADGRSQRLPRSEQQGEAFYQAHRRSLEAHILERLDEYAPLLTGRMRSGDDWPLPLLVACLERAAGDPRTSAAAPAGALLSKLYAAAGPLRRWFDERTFVGERGARPEVQRALLDLLRLCLLLAGELAVSPSLHPDMAALCAEVFARYTEPLSGAEKDPGRPERRAQAHEVRVKALELLPLLLACPGPHTAKAMERVEEIAEGEFPLASADLEVGTVEEREYREKLEALLAALPACGSAPLLRALLPTFAEENHRHGPALQRTLSALVVRLADAAAPPSPLEPPRPPGLRRLPETRPRDAVALCVRALGDEREAPFLRRRLVHRLLLPLLERLPRAAEGGRETVPALRDLLAPHVGALAALAAGPEPGSAAELAAAGAPEAARRAALASRALALAVLEVALRRLPQEDVRTGALNAAYNQGAAGKGGELTSKLGKVCRAVIMAPPERVEEGEADGRLRERAELGQAAYCAFASLAANSPVGADAKKGPAFFAAFFKHGADMHWENLVDCSRPYRFALETDFARVRGPTEALRAGGAEVEDGPAAPASRERGGRYLATQYLRDSSLSGSAPLLAAFVDARGAFASQTAELDGEAGRPSDGGPTSEERAAVEAAGEALEADEINRNPAMAAVLRIIALFEERWQGASAAPPPEIQPKGAEMPFWAKMLHDALAAEAAPPNVRLFLAKVVLNRPSVFRRWAARFMKPMIDAATLAADKRHGSEPLNYFVRDVLQLLLLWSVAVQLPDPLEPARTISRPAAPPPPPDVAVPFLSLVISSAAHPRLAVWRDNLVFLRYFVELWKPSLASLTVGRAASFFLQKGVAMKATDAKERAATRACMLTGLHVLSLFVGNEFAPWDDARDKASEKANAGALYALLLRVAFEQPAASLYLAAADVIGIVLKWANGGWDEQRAGERAAERTAAREAAVTLLEAPALARLEELLRASRGEDLQRFVGICDRVAVYHPPIAAAFDRRLLDLARSLPGEFRARALELVVTLLREEGPGAQLAPFALPRLPDFLRIRDEECALAALEAARLLLPRTGAEQALALLQSCAAAAAASGSVPVRVAYHRVVEWAYEHHGELRASPAVRALALAALADDSQEVQKAALKFWSGPGRLAEHPVPRLAAALELLHTPETEPRFLGAAAVLVLRLCNRSQEYGEAALHPSLSPNAQFSDMRVEGGAFRRAAAASLPLFSPASLALAAEEDGEATGSQPAGALLATQSQRLFSQTQDGGDAGTQSSLLFTARGSDRRFSAKRELHVFSSQFISPAPKPRRAGPSQPFSQSSQQQSQAAIVSSVGSLGSAASQDATDAVRGALLSTAASPTAAVRAGRYRQSDEGPADEAGGEAAEAAHRQSNRARIYATARAAQRRTAARERAEERGRYERRHRVRILRSYRAGEVPDVEITARDVLKPLKALARREPAVARALLAALVPAALDAPPYAVGADEHRAEGARLRSALAAAVGRSAGTPAFLSAVAALCAPPREAPALAPFALAVRPADVAAAARASGALAAGIAILERRVWSAEEARIAEAQNAPAAPPPSKRQRTADGSSPSIGGTLSSGGPAASSQDIGGGPGTPGSGEAGGEAADREAWAALAELYREAGEADVALALFDGRGTTEDVQRGLRAELEGSFWKAYEHYDAPFNLDPPPFASLREEAFAQRSRIRCLRECTLWDDVANQVSAQCDDAVRDPVKGLLAAGREDLLRTFADAAWRAEEPKWRAELAALLAAPDDAGRQRIAAALPFEAALHAAEEGRDAEARSAIAAAYAQFAERWSAAHPLAAPLRHAALSSLPPLALLDELLREAAAGWAAAAADKRSAAEVLGPLATRLEEWARRRLSPAWDGAPAWDAWARAGARCADVLFKRLSRPIEEKLETQTNLAQAEQRRLRELSNEAQRTAADFKCLIFRVAGAAAAGQRNATAAERLLGASVRSALVGSSDAESFAAQHAKLKLARLKAVAKADAAQRLKGLHKVVASAASLLERQQGEARGRLLTLQAKALEEAGQAMAEGAAGTDGACGRTAAEARARAMAAYRSAAAALDPSEDGAPAAAKGAAAAAAAAAAWRRAGKAQLRAALFCDSLLQAREAGGAAAARDALPETGPEVEEAVVEGLLRAMARGAPGAPDRFPRVLALIDDAPAAGGAPRVGSRAREAFRRLVPRVPSWQLLPWAEQMVARLGHAPGPALAPVLASLARAWPQAVLYAWRTSLPQLPPEGRQHAARAGLEAALEGPGLRTAREFAEQLELLAAPEMRLGASGGLYEALDALVAAKERPAALPAALLAARTAFRAVRPLVFDASCPGLGSEGEEYAQKAAATVQEMFGPDGGRIGSLDADKVKALKDALGTSNAPVALQSRQTGRKKGERVIPPGRRKLALFSRWLAEFDERVAPHSPPLEVPGQYDGRSCPEAGRVVRVAGFDPEVLVLRSKQRPMRLTALGDDLRGHAFLAKTMEDLRQDARVEQAFALINGLLRGDPAAARRRLRVRTYAVVTCSATAGLLQWVPRTVTYREAIGAGPADGRYQRAEEEYKKLAGRYKGGYKDLTEKAPPELIRATFSRIADGFGRDRLSRWLRERAAGPEAWLAARAAFARSYAAAVVAGYLLGVGDRHPDNLLLDSATGEAVPIDFGYAFGVGTKLLSISELVPTRISPNLAAALRPLPTTRVLEDLMTLCAAAVRARGAVLVALLDVFSKEPLLDWTRPARRQMQAHGDTGPGAGSSSEGAMPPPAAKGGRRGGGAAGAGAAAGVEWYPQQVLATVRRKLRGDHPALVLVEELVQGGVHRGLAATQRAILARGGRRPEDGDAGGLQLPPREQMRGLIELATDERLLGCMYLGWAPWA